MIKPMCANELGKDFGNCFAELAIPSTLLMNSEQVPILFNNLEQGQERLHNQFNHSKLS